MHLTLKFIFEENFHFQNLTWVEMITLFLCAAKKYNSL